MTKYREFVEFAKATARQLLREVRDPGDDFPMTLIALHPGEDPHVWSLPGEVANDDATKDVLAEAIRRAAKETKPSHLAMLSCAWMSLRPVERGLAAEDGSWVTQPSQDPERIEIAFAYVVDHEQTEFHTAQIKRGAFTRPVLGEWIDQTKAFGSPGQMGGRFGDALREAVR